MRLFGRSDGTESLREPLPMVRLIAFAVVGLLALAYLLFSVVGIKTFEGNYRVAVEMPVTGGLFPGSQVTYRGVPVGTVSSIDVSANRGYVVANLDIHDGVHIPVTTKAVVADRSPAGEQYIDFEPYAASTRYLQDNSVIPPSQTVRPPSLSGLLNTVTAFSNSVNVNELRTVFNQLEIAFGGTGSALGRIIDNSAQLVASLEAVEPATIDLLRTGGQVLDTQAAHDGDLRRFSVSLRQLAGTLRSDDPQTVKLIDAALQTTQQVGPLLHTDAGNIGMLLVNLVTVGHLAVQRLPGLKALLVSLPGGLQALASGVHGKHVNFRLLTELGTACAYPNTRRRTPFDDHRGPPLTNGYCLHPTSDEQQRGSVYAPRPPGDTTAGPGPSGSASSSRATSTPARTRAANPAHSDSWLKVFTAGEQ
jgi:phospholipid/cholesterol/gamma-HCH transport system substrate-binding protein